MSKWMSTSEVSQWQSRFGARKQHLSSSSSLSRCPDFVQPEAGHVIEALVIYGAVADEQAPVLVAFFHDIAVQQGLRFLGGLLVLFQALLFAMLPCHQGVLRGFKPLSAHALLGNELGRYMQQTRRNTEDHECV